MTNDITYFSHPRPEVLARVPMTAATILDVGCGQGRLGEALKARQACEMIGIELDERAAALARATHDLVLTGNVEQMEIEHWDGYFDVIIAADVLEHLRDPAAQLARMRRWLKPGGKLVASIPNARHQSLLRSLLEGNWTYERAGLLDEDHRQVLTRRDMTDLLQAAGYTVVSLAAVPDAEYDDWLKQGRPNRLDFGRLVLADLPVEEAQEFFVYQWLVVAEATEGTGYRLQVTAGEKPSVSADCSLSPVPCSLHPLPPCLVLMITHGRLEYTKPSVEAMLAQDYPNLKFVVWDNASPDGGATLAWLRQRLRDEPRATLIASPVNRGVVYPMNEVWFGDHGCELLVKLDNDTVAPPELVRRLAECHVASARFGVLSGFHFRAEGEALVDDRRVDQIDGVRVVRQPYVGGCAVMVRKEVLDRFGPIPMQVTGNRLQVTAGTKPVASADCSLSPVTCPLLPPHGSPLTNRPFMDSGWTTYQQRLTDAGLVNGYPWPPIHVDHLEDTRSPGCIRTPEYERYKRDLRGMDQEEFTQRLCVWRPIWEGDTGRENADGGRGEGTSQVTGDRLQVTAEGEGSKENRGSPKTNDEGPMTNDKGPMTFSQDFRRDFEQIDFFGAPFALARFADGERAICMGRAIEGADGWRYAGGESQFRDHLLAALRYNAPGYYLGLSDGCCDREARDWYLREITVPMSQVTFSNLFVNANYSRFKAIDFSGACIVAAEGGDFWVPPDATNSAFDIDRLVERLLSVDRTILVAAGPAAAIIIHRYWQRARPDRRQVIVDVGSAIDELTKGRTTRQYQVAGTRNAELVCTWEG